MPSREPEFYKDKIEVSLDGRQIFYLFFGGAAIAGLVFVIGVMVGRRIEARSHLDRAETQPASDPLAAYQLSGERTSHSHSANAVPAAHISEGRALWVAKTVADCCIPNEPCGVGSYP